ncbi:B12-binding domain-containing radical SAM protein [bacterium]|nr:B12-binding domain-containing radical SAM protein [bacterium]
MSKQIILVSISNPEDMHIPPLALLYVGGALKKEGYFVRVLHISTEELSKFAKKIVQLDPLFVGFSVITGNQTKASSDLSKLIKKQNSNIPIIWGGIHPSLLTHQCISENYIDYVVRGEGEKTIVELTKALEGKLKLKDILGIAYKNKERKPIINPPRPLMENIDDYKLDWSLINVKKHLDKQWGCDRILAFITSRGCPFNCAFCYNLRFNQRRWRPHSAEKMISEINFMKEQYNIDAVRYYDDFFFANPSRALSILKKVKLSWYGELRVNIVSDNLVNQLIQTQCKEILIGCESGCNRILEMVNKQQTVEDIRRAVKLLSKAKQVKLTSSFIVGLPTETKQETFKTINFALELFKIHSNIRYSFGFYLPYPGSDIYELAVKMGFKPPKRTEDWSKLDRWSNKLDLTWLDWIQDPNYFMKIRRYINLLPLKETKIPFIRNIPEKRLKQKDFSHNLELNVLSYVQRQFAVKNSFIRNVGGKILPYIRSK